MQNLIVWMFGGHAVADASDGMQTNTGDYVDFRSEIKPAISAMPSFYKCTYFYLYNEQFSGWPNGYISASVLKMK